MVHLTVCSFHVRYAFQIESTLYSFRNVEELLARSRREIWSLSECSWTRTHNHLVHKRTLEHLAELAKWLSCFVGTYLYGAFDCMFLSYHVHVWSESTLYSRLNVKELIARSSREIRNLNDCDWTRTRDHLFHKRTLNHLAKLAK